MIHFAAIAYVGESVQDPGKYYQDNVAGRSACSRRCAANGCGKIIFSSTCDTHGMPENELISEE